MYLLPYILVDALLLSNYTFEVSKWHIHFKTRKASIIFFTRNALYIWSLKMATDISELIKGFHKIFYKKWKTNEGYFCFKSVLIFAWCWVSFIQLAKATDISKPERLYSPNFFTRNRKPKKDIFILLIAGSYFCLISNFFNSVGKSILRLLVQPLNFSYL